MVARDADERVGAKQMLKARREARDALHGETGRNMSGGLLRGHRDRRSRMGVRVGTAARRDEPSRQPCRLCLEQQGQPELRGMGATSHAGPLAVHRPLYFQAARAVVFQPLFLAGGPVGSSS
jgi:hypothetical protein